MIKPRTARTLVALAVVALVLGGAVSKIGVGTLSAFSLNPLSYLCPLGYLEVSLASRDLLPALWLGLALVLLSIVVFGKFFCGWVCPANLFSPSRHNGHAAQAHPTGSLASKGVSPFQASPRTVSNRTLSAEDGSDRAASLSRYAVLGGTLLSSLVFGFPVFCAICPIGLFFGALFAVKRLVFAQEPGWEVLLFPALLAVEFFALKSWCRSICPLGALLSLASSLNRFFRPSVNASTCLASSGTKCRECVNVCPEGIDLRKKTSISLLRECTRCLECSDKCPVQAIRFPLRNSL
jgi:ferredoxin-type protein NapH